MRRPHARGRPLAVGSADWIGQGNHLCAKTACHCLMSVAHVQSHTSHRRDMHVLCRQLPCAPFEKATPENQGLFCQHTLIYGMACCSRGGRAHKAKPEVTSCLASPSSRDRHGAVQLSGTQQ